MTATATVNQTSKETRPGPQNLTWSLFLISALGLFLEMMLIRWIGTEIRIFAYLQNTVGHGMPELPSTDLVSSRTPATVGTDRVDGYSVYTRGAGGYHGHAQCAE